MTENKLYAQCREEALKQFKRELKPSIDAMELSQLTAEIYGMKLLDMVHKAMNDHQSIEIETEIIIGTTQDLHDHFVREFNKENS